MNDIERARRRLRLVRDQRTQESGRARRDNSVVLAFGIGMVVGILIFAFAQRIAGV